ncbi:MAG: mercury resistance system periplasmic binding protein MerP [Steroidobacteraceae bacterium]|jgi:mercuric ion binding protein|nr:mercury resistance system periplasmic binding protein MerP [Steroidobacteraceae bacterium]
MHKTSITLASLIAIGSPAWAAMQTVKLSLPTMDCPVCPITVKKALARVPGVSKAVVDFDKRQATVSFDDAKTNAGALTRATTDAGYPSTLIK